MSVVPPRPELTKHAIERYRERVAPGLSRSEAEVELRIRLDAAPMMDYPPDWAQHAHAELCAPLDAETMVVLRKNRRGTRRGFIASTVLTRESDEAPADPSGEAQRSPIEKDAA